MMSERKPYRNFKKRESNLSTEQKIGNFVKRNSQSGFFTKVSTISSCVESNDSLDNNSPTYSMSYPQKYQICMNIREK